MLNGPYQNKLDDPSVNYQKNCVKDAQMKEHCTYPSRTSEPSLPESNSSKQINKTNDNFFVLG